MPQRRLSEYHTRFMELYNQKLSDGDIGKTLGFHKGTVSVYRRKKLSLPPNFSFGHNKIVFSEAEQEEIIKMRFRGASISEIARKFNINLLTMTKLCREMGLDTSKGARKWIKCENDVIRIWTCLEERGPMSQKELIERLNISQVLMAEYAKNLPDIFERYKFAVGTGSGSRGGTKYGGSMIYGDLSYNDSGLIVSLVDDPRLIDYIATRTPFKIETYHDARTFVIHLSKQVGLERAREVVRKKGWVFGEDLKMTPINRPQKFTDDQLRKLYDKKLNDRQIAKKLGVTTPAIGFRRRRLGLPSHHSRTSAHIENGIPCEVCHNRRGKVISKVDGKITCIACWKATL